LNTGRPNALGASVYPLLLAAMAGATFMDFLYASARRSGVAEAESGVADVLLLLTLPVLLAGVLATVLGAGRVRWLMLASLVVFCLTFLFPLLAGLVPAVSPYLQASGPILRNGLMLGALLLAVLGQREAAR